MYYCGIDIAKREHTVVVIDEGDNMQFAGLTISNDQQGFEKLLQQLRPYRGQIQVGMESTGHYWLTLYMALTEAGYQLTIINPLQIHAYRRIDLRKRKTDQLDAMWIAQFMRFARLSPTSQQLPALRQLRELARFRMRLTQQIGDCKRKVIAILDQVFPEYEQLFSNVFLQSSRQLLAYAVTAEEFAEFDLDELEQLLLSASRGRFGRPKAEEIQSAARRSIGISLVTDALRLEVQCLLEQMKLLEQQRVTIEEALAVLMEQIPQYITTIPGIGLVSGATILGEVGDIQRFASAEKLVAYAGIDPSIYESGQFTGDQMHMSKRGSPYLRFALWQAATAALLHNEELKGFYDRKRAQGKPHGVALGAVCRKLLLRIYWILKEHRPYEVR